MITPFDVLLINSLDILDFVFLFLFLMFAVFFFFGCSKSFGRFLDEYEFDTESEKVTIRFFKKKFKIIGFLFIVFGLLFIFVPSTKTAYEMYIIPKIVNNENLQKLPTDLIKYIEHNILTNSEK